MLLQLKKFLPYILFLSLITTVDSVWAQSPSQLDLTVSPSTLELTTQPGKSIQDRIRIHNNSNSALTLQITVEKLVPSQDKTGIAIQESATDNEIKQWIHFDKSQFVAPPNEWTDIGFTINVPSDAAFGYYFALVVSPAISVPEKDSPTTVLNAGVAVLGTLTAQVPEGTIANAEVATFGPHSFINEWLPVNFKIDIKNTGNIHIKPRGNIFIQDYSGKEVALLEVNPEQGIILPDSLRSFDTDWSDGFLVREPVIENGHIKQDSNGKTIRHLKIHWDKLTHMRLGRYTANLLMVFDNGQRDITLEGKTTFWVIPYKLLSGALIGFILFILLIRWILRSYIKRQVRKQQYR